MGLFAKSEVVLVPYLYLAVILSGVRLDEGEMNEVEGSLDVHL